MGNLKLYRPTEIELEMQKLDYDLEDGLISETDYLLKLQPLLARFEAEEKQAA